MVALISDINQPCFVTHVLNWFWVFYYLLNQPIDIASTIVGPALADAASLSVEDDGVATAAIADRNCLFFSSISSGLGPDLVT